MGRLRLGPQFTYALGCENGQVCRENVHLGGEKVHFRIHSRVTANFMPPYLGTGVELSGDTYTVEQRREGGIVPG